jgi:membrane protein DedA with SNARE-associated domain
VLAVIDTSIIPFLQHLYTTVGYLGVFFAMVIESTLLPLPSELILPLAGWMVVDPSQIEPLTHAHWNFWVVVVVGVAANTTGSIFGYYLGAKLGRPFLDRWGRFLLIRKHEVDQAESFFARWGSPTAFFSRLLPGVRSVISFIAGVSHMPHRTLHRLFDPGRHPVDHRARLRGHRSGLELDGNPRHAAALRHADPGRAASSPSWLSCGGVSVHPGWRRTEPEA